MRQSHCASLTDAAVAQLTLPIDELARLADHLAPWRERDRRRTLRFGLSRPMLVHPLSDDFQTQAEPVVALARNLSCDGLSLVTPRDPGVRYVRLTVDDGEDAGEPWVFYLEVGRCRRLGATFEIAGRFVQIASSAEFVG